MPQFCVELDTSMQLPLQFIWLPVQVGPLPPPPPVPGLPGVVGVAQLAASTRQPKAKVRRTEGERGRVLIDLPRGERIRVCRSWSTSKRLPARLPHPPKPVALQSGASE